MVVFNDVLYFQKNILRVLFCHFAIFCQGKMPLPLVRKVFLKGLHAKVSQLLQESLDSLNTKVAVNSM